jgi:hypothetical protein
LGTVPTETGKVRKQHAELGANCDA